MNNASYRYAVKWIALNDSWGDPEALDPESVQHQITVVLIADLFGVLREKVAQDVVKERKKHDS
ncbi:MAG: hypothetical protein KDA84_29150 [Planctomycetaceae bacterium]|nr:hypothetical protein [Planctomycetaceae bacterium]